MTVYDQFDAAARAYAADPNPTTLLHLNRRALPLLDTARQEHAWMPIDAPDALAGDFYAVRVVCDRRLDAEEVSRLSGCLGYALRCTLAGEDLTDPTVFSLSDGATNLPFWILVTTPPKAVAAILTFRARSTWPAR